MKKITLFLVFVLMVIGSDAQLFKKKSKKEVPGVEVTLTRHPDKVVLKGKDKLDYYLFFSLEKKCLFITDKKEMYDSLADFLPLRSVSGREVLIDGPSIDPFTIFTKVQLDETSQRVGFAINKYNTFRIFNVELIEIPATLPAKKGEPVVPPEKVQKPTTPTKKTW